MFQDGNGTTYSGTEAKFTNTPFGMTLPAGKTAAADLVATPAYTPFAFNNSTTSFRQQADNSVAGEMRDCGECHVGGGMMEYMVNPGAANLVSSRTSLRDYVFGGAVTAFNALIDIFNPTATSRGGVVVQNYAETGVLEMDCLICHQNDYDWAKRKEAVRKGEFDASRALGANLALSAVNGTTVFYNSTSVKTVNGQLVVDLSTKINKQPSSNQCNSCHLGSTQEKYQVDWKKRGEMWTVNGAIKDVHGAVGCMGCHERKDKADTSIGTDGLTGTKKLGMCDPAKGGASPFDAMWNQLDGKEFKDCAGCHQPAAVPTYLTYGAPDSRSAHARAGLDAKVVFKNFTGTTTKVSHIDLIDCTACHVKKTGFTGGAFVDGTGADEEGRVALHDSEHVAKDMTNGTAVHWQGGKMYSANLLTSFFWRDMNGLKTANGGLDANNDGREAGMDPLLQTHVNNINNTNGLQAISHDGVIDATEIGVQKNAIAAGIRAQLGITGTTQTTNAFLPKISFLLVPFKASHNTAPADQAWGVKGCKECHSAAGTIIAANDADNRSGAAYTAGGFYNGTYPINGNLEGNFTFDSDQVTTYTKVNGLVDVTDSHPSVVTKDGKRSVPVKLLSKFDTPYVQTKTAGQYLRNIDRSEVLYEETFQTLDESWYNSATPILGGAIAAACNSASPFYCEDPTYIFNAAKKGATSTLGWTLKVEVKDVATGAITARTKSIGDDKIVDVAGIITALGTAFTSNPDFIVEAVGSQIRLTAATGKEIRISSQSDVGPFGLKGKLWKSASIVRPSGTYSTRSGWLTYLNGITKESVGMAAATAPVAAFTVNGASTSDFSALPLLKGTAYPLAISAAANSYTKYSFDHNAGTGATLDTTTTPATVTFNKAGIWRVTLTAINPDGRTATKLQRVSVTEPQYAALGTLVTAPVTTTVTNGTSTYNVTKIMTTVPVTIDTLIPGTDYDTVRFNWGDGTKATVVTAAAGAAPATYSQDHQYSRYSKYLNTTTNTYNYKTTVQLFKGTTLVSSKGIAVSIPK